jgi:threonine/homoserine/homoserine lactone efflux protein
LAAPGLRLPILIAGAAYLAYLGWVTFRSGRSEGSPRSAAPSGRPWIRSFREGFIVNLLNLKAALYFLGIFSVLLTPETPRWIKAAAAVEMIVIEIAYFSLVAVIAGRARGTAWLARWELPIQRTLGALLILLAILLLAQGLRTYGPSSSTSLPHLHHLSSHPFAVASERGAALDRGP